MSGRFSGKVAVVTSALSDTGSRITEHLIDEGARVVVAESNVDRAAGAGRRFGPEVLGHCVDTTNESETDSLLGVAIAHFGTLDLVFNVAGDHHSAALTEMSFENWDESIRLNLHSAFLGTRLAARRFISRGTPGVIVNILGLNAPFPPFYGVGYSASRAGTAMLTKQAALELSGHGIRVNAVTPGISRSQDSGVTTPTDRAQARRVAAEELAAAAVYLASEDASYISGDNLVVDAAWSDSRSQRLRLALH